MIHIAYILVAQGDRACGRIWDHIPKLWLTIQAPPKFVVTLHQLF